MRETIEETTVGDLGGTAVPMASMVFDGEYALADGTLTRGVCGVLVVGDGVWAGEGSAIEIDGRTWTVVEARKERGKMGWMTLESA